MITIGVDKMDAVFEEMKRLYEFRLYSNLDIVANLILSVAENVPGVLSSEKKLVTLLYYGKTCYKLRNFSKAAQIYNNALIFKKLLIKTKLLTKKPENEKNILTDTEIKFRIYLCYLNLGNTDQALSTLQSIPAKERNAEINMALAKLFHQTGMDRSAITCYREVLKECPLALEAADGLLKLGVQGVEVNSFVVNGPLSGIGWLNLWIKAYAHSHAREFPQAIATFNQLLDAPSPVMKNVKLLTTLGEIYYYHGDVNSCKQTFQQIFVSDPTVRKGYGIVSTICLSERNIDELEKLVPVNWENTDEKDSETWTAISCLLYSHSKLSMAAVFAQKACVADPRNIEALVLKGCILYDMRRLDSAVPHFREAFRIAPHRYEPHKGLVDCYLAQNRTKEALTIAVNCCKVDNNSPRALTLYALVLMKEKHNNKAKQLLEKALSQNRHYIPAVYLLADILEEDGMLNMAIELLDKQRTLNPCSKVHQLLAEMLHRAGDMERAFHHYHAALRMDPNNQKAKEGLNSLESNTVPPKPPNFMNSSDTEGIDEQLYEAGSSEVADDSDHDLSHSD